MEIKKINNDKSRLTWIGKKKIGGQHSGSIKLQEGYLAFEEGELRDAEMTVDMASLLSEDLKGMKKKKMEKHLHSDDFFSTDKHKKTIIKTLQIDKTPSGYKIVGDLHIKDISNQVTFEVGLNENSAQSTLKIDRTKFGIKYGSNRFFKDIGDRAIADHFILKVDLQF